MLSRCCTTKSPSPSTTPFRLYLLQEQVRCGKRNTTQFLDPAEVESRTVVGGEMLAKDIAFQSYERTRFKSSSFNMITVINNNILY